MARAVGRPLSALDRPWASRTVAVAIARQDTVLHAGLADVPLVAGDALLLLVSGSDVPALRDDADFIVLSERDNPTTRRRRAPLALAIVAAVVVVAAAGWLPIEIAALLGAAAMAVGRCIGVDRLYRSVELRVLVLLAAMLPLGIAIEKTGAADAVVKSAFALLPMDHPVLALAVIYGLTMVMTEVITNNATAVLMTPIALALAEQLGVQPAPFLVAVAFAASTSFSTPIGYQTNTMVYAAGGYGFADFLKVGVPLNLLFWGVSVWAIPRWFPF
jgi:di/tricarboxylate transporter